MGTIVGRFAPSPSGRMHLGNVLCCFLAWLSVRQQGGRLLLRMEDLDTARCPVRHAAQLMDDLRWLGLLWDDGPALPEPGQLSDCGQPPDHGQLPEPGQSLDHGQLPDAVHLPEPDERYWQSRRTAVYEAALEPLRPLVYPCFCTRAELHAASAPHREDGQAVYPGTCRDLTAAEVREKSKIRRPALRLRVPDRVYSFTDGHMGAYGENLAHSCGDFLVRRSDGVFAYQLAVVVDDAAMGVTEVVRGADLLPSTPRQLYLYDLLGAAPPRFVHFPLLLAGDGKRLSKRDRGFGLSELRGVLPPEEILGRLAYLAGFNPSRRPGPAESFLPEFDWERIPRENLVLPGDLFS